MKERRKKRNTYAKTRTLTVAVFMTGKDYYHGMKWMWHKIIFAMEFQTLANNRTSRHSVDMWADLRLFVRSVGRSFVRSFVIITQEQLCPLEKIKCSIFKCRYLPCVTFVYSSDRKNFKENWIFAMKTVFDSKLLDEIVEIFICFCLYNLWAFMRTSWFTISIMFQI